jgi:hypothetical protein
MPKTIKTKNKNQRNYLEEQEMKQKLEFIKE